jgi:hypothetical protein
MTSKATPERLREVFKYDAATGNLTRDGFLVFNTVGPRGFLCGTFEGKFYTKHRLAWAIHYGVWPVGDIKHINGIRTDNRITNLEEVEPYKTRVRKKNINPLPTYEEMAAEYQYNPDTGRIYNTWKQCFMSVQSTGYLYGSHKGRNLLAHRVAWLLYYGEWPTGEVDHIDHDQMNNRIKNLRDVSSTVNSQNKGLGMSNTSGIVGVSWVKDTARWKAYIGIENRLIVLGTFVNFKDAVAKRRAAEFQYGFHENHGKEVLI